jgi:fumarate reductase flavoprotein subunit
MKNKSISTGWRNPPAPIPPGSIAAEYQADVVVVGLGHSGTPALRAAAEAGASVIGIEKMQKESFNVFGRDVGHINSRFLAGRGVPVVDPLDLFNEMMRRGGNRANPKLVMQFCRKCGDAFDWYTEPFSREQMDTVIIDKWPLGRYFSGEISGQKFWAGTAQFDDYNPTSSIFHAVVANQDLAVKRGARLFFGLDAQQLVMEGGRVAGVIARDNQDKYIKITANRGVILAAGDFGGNREMCAELLPDVADILDEGEDFVSLGRDGRGIQMGVWAGGRLEARPLASMGGNSDFLCGVIESFGSLWIDQNGRRYCNESFGDPVFAGFPAAQEKRGLKIVVFDSTILEDLQFGPPAHTSFFANSPEAQKRLNSHLASAREAGAQGYHIGPIRGHAPGSTTVYAADSPEKLADYIGFKDSARQNFLDSLKRYNECAAKGRDEDFGKDARLLRPIDAPHYYAEVRTRSGIGFFLVTCGGLLTDEWQNVLDAKRDPIPGLYATGNCCGRRFGIQYSTPISGMSISIAITLGREAGRIAAGALK